jgi:hypothetical protein
MSKLRGQTYWTHHQCHLPPGPRQAPLRTEGSDPPTPVTGPHSPPPPTPDSIARSRCVIRKACFDTLVSSAAADATACRKKGARKNKNLGNRDCMHQALAWRAPHQTSPHLTKPHTFSSLLQRCSDPADSFPLSDSCDCPRGTRGRESKTRVGTWSRSDLTLLASMLSSSTEKAHFCHQDIRVAQAHQTLNPFLTRNAHRPETLNPRHNPPEHQRVQTNMQNII